MIKTYILTVGKIKESWLLEALQEYEARLTSRMRIEWKLFKTDLELDQHLKTIPSYIALDPEGEMLESTSLPGRLNRSTLVFAIGGADGLSTEALIKASWRWSLSRLTFTHQMCRLILVEQLYRCLEIDRGSPYHR